MSTSCHRLSPRSDLVLVLMATTTTSAAALGSAARLCPCSTPTLHQRVPRARQTNQTDSQPRNNLTLRFLSQSPQSRSGSPSSSAVSAPQIPPPRLPPAPHLARPHLHHSPHKPHQSPRKRLPQHPIVLPWQRPRPLLPPCRLGSMMALRRRSPIHGSH
jgi:hypothetical protein